MRRRSAASIALATLLGGASTLSMCGTGSEINGVKFSPTAMKFDVTILGGGNGTVDDTTRAGQPGNTEIEGVPMVCTERDAKGNRFCEAQK